MKKLTGSLVLSFSLLLISGCRSAGETRGPEDASTPSSPEQTPSGSVDTNRGALNSDGTSQPPAGAAQPTPGGDPGAMKPDSGSDQSASAGSGSGGGTTATPLSPEARLAQENCLNQWLKSKKLDEFGHPEGTMYAGGSPLFNEVTGESRDRLEYVYSRQPEAKKACAHAGHPPAQKK
jgi:hypothetical protein